MKALTVCQPFAHLLLLPNADPAAKRVENRTWSLSHRGPMLIHAGKSRKWLEPGDEERWPDMAFGAIVGTVEVVGCFSIDDIENEKLPPGFEWVRDHPHTEGPFCIVVKNPLRFEVPIPYRGQLGLFDVPDVLRELAAGRDV